MMLNFRTATGTEVATHAYHARLGVVLPLDGWGDAIEALGGNRHDCRMPMIVDTRDLAAAARQLDFVISGE